MPQDLQAKLLRVIQERVITRLGSNEPIPLDVRFIALSKVDLDAGSRRWPVPRRPALPAERRDAAACRRWRSGGTISPCSSCNWSARRLRAIARETSMSRRRSSVRFPAANGRAMYASCAMPPTAMCWGSDRPEPERQETRQRIGRRKAVRARGGLRRQVISDALDGPWRAAEARL